MVNLPGEFLYPAPGLTSDPALICPWFLPRSPLRHDGVALVELARPLSLIMGESKPV